MNGISGAEARGAAPIAELRDVCKTFRQGDQTVRALDGVSLSLRAAELTLLMGPSGSGKTTLLQILGLLQRADRGAIRFADRSMDGLGEAALTEARRAGVVFIFQGFNLMEALTARGNVALAHKLAGGERRTAPAERCLARVGLQQRSDFRPPQLSGGERQRVAIARALACPGRLVLADEPTANLDWHAAEEVISSLAQLARDEGKAVLVVTHDSRLERFADRIVRILDGRIVEDRRLNQPATISKNADTPIAPAAPPNAATAPGAAGRAAPRGLSAGAWALTLFVLLLIVTAAIIYLRHNRGGATTPAAAPPASAPTPWAAAAPGVIEPSTQIVEIRTERPGRIKAILRQSGERIRAGEPLVLLDDATAAAVVAQARAEMELADADLAKLMAWDRQEERARAAAAVERARARHDRAQRERKRVESLAEQRSATESEYQQTVEEERLAAAALEEARQSARLSEAGPTVEQVRVAEAQQARAAAALRAAQTALDLCTIPSPLDGHVIYRHLEPGEVVVTDAPVPILSIGNLDDLRVRAEVDEADIARVRVGQSVRAYAEAYPEREFAGKVVRLEPIMGRKTIRTERSTEQKDAKVREVLIELAPAGVEFPIGMQMTVRFLQE